MAVVKVYDQDKTEQGELTLTPEVFEVAVRPEILHERGVLGYPRSAFQYPRSIR